MAPNTDPPAAPSGWDLRFPLLLACFFLSGFAALLYETVWSRQLSFVFGTSELAVSAVLAAYMGGLALGAMLAARLSQRVRRPVLTYGVLELVIAVGALAVPTFVAGTRALYLGWLGSLPTIDEGNGLVVALFQLTSSFLVLAPCTIPMGATLPLLAKHAVEDDASLGPRIGTLYATNTAGAIGGTLVAAFALIPNLGLRSTVFVGAGLNFLVFVGAALLARQVSGHGAGSADDAPASPPKLPFHWVLPLMTISGAVSFAYEVLWFRLLGWILGGSIAAFSTMLASFLIGIFLGSAVASRWATSRAAALIGLASAQLITAAAAWGAFLFTDRIPELAASLGAGSSNLGAGAVLAIVVLVPMTLSIGATFPFAVRIFARDADDASEASARVYGWNTIGSIVGSIGAGFVLLPALGYEGTLVAGVAINLGLGLLVLAAAGATRARLPLAGAAAVVAIALVALPPQPPLRLLSSSPLSVGTQVEGELRALRVGRSATVTLFDEGSHVKMYTNGLPESGAPILEPIPHRVLARMLSRLPVLFHPEAREALVIGLGAGITLGAVPPSIEHVEVIELEEEVVEANRLIPDRVGAHPIDDPRVTVRVGDARGHLMLATKRYDIIVSQPSHPWTAGASHLYTREFFELVRDRLDEDGVFSQWIGIRFVSPELFPKMVATMAAAFPHVQVFRPTAAGIVFLGRGVPFDDDAIARAIAQTPAIFESEAIHRTEDVIAIRRLDEAGAAALIEGVAPITDNENPFAATRQPVHNPGWLEQQTRRFEPVLGDARLVGSDASLDLARVARQMSRHGAAIRAAALANALDAPHSDLIRGWVAFDGGRRPSAVAAFAKARAAGLESPTLVAGEVVSGSYAGSLEALPRELRTLSLALDAATDRRWSDLEALDADLAEIGPNHLLFTEALTLRSRWRRLDDSEQSARELWELVGISHREHLSPAKLVDRAEAAQRIGKTKSAAASLIEFATARSSDVKRDFNLRTRANRIAMELPEGRLRSVVLEAVGRRLPRSEKGGG